MSTRSKSIPSCLDFHADNGHVKISCKLLGNYWLNQINQVIEKIWLRTLIHERDKVISLDPQTQLSYGFRSLSIQHICHMDQFYDTFVVLVSKTFTFFYVHSSKFFLLSSTEEWKSVEVWYLRPKQNLRLDLRLDIWLEKRDLVKL